MTSNAISQNLTMTLQTLTTAIIHVADFTVAQLSSPTFARLFYNSHVFVIVSYSHVSKTYFAICCVWPCVLSCNNSLKFYPCNNSTSFSPLQEVASWGLAPCAATILSLGPLFAFLGHCGWRPMLLQLGCLYMSPLVLLVNYVALSNLNSPHKVIVKWTWSRGIAKKIIAIWSTIVVTEEQPLVVLKLEAWTIDSWEFVVHQILLTQIGELKDNWFLCEEDTHCETRSMRAMVITQWCSIQMVMKNPENHCVPHSLV